MNHFPTFERSLSNIYDADMPSIPLYITYTCITYGFFYIITRSRRQRKIPWGSCSGFAAILTLWASPKCGTCFGVGADPPGTAAAAATGTAEAAAAAGVGRGRAVCDSVT